MGFFTKKPELTWKDTTPPDQMCRMQTLVNKHVRVYRRYQDACVLLNRAVDAKRAVMMPGAAIHRDYIEGHFAEVRALVAAKEEFATESEACHIEHDEYLAGLKSAYVAQQKRQMIRKARGLRREILKATAGNMDYWHPIRVIVKVLVGAWYDQAVPSMYTEHPSELSRLLDARDMLRVRLKSLPENREIKGVLSEIDVSGVGPRLEASLKAVLARIDDLFVVLEALPAIIKSVNAAIEASSSVAVVGMRDERDVRDQAFTSLTGLVTEIEKVLGPSKRRHYSNMVKLSLGTKEQIESGEFGGGLLTTGEFAALAEVDAVAMFRSFHPIETPEEQEFAKERPGDAEAIRRAELAAEHNRS